MMFAQQWFHSDSRYRFRRLFAIQRVCWLLLLLVATTSTRGVVAQAPPVPAEIDRQDVNVTAALRSLPRTHVVPGEQFIIEVHVDNIGVEESPHVMVDLFFEEHQLEVLDTHFPQGEAWVSEHDDEHIQVTFDDIDDGDFRTAQLIVRVRNTLPYGSMIYVWGEWYWEYDERNVWHDDVIERVVRHDTNTLDIPVVNPNTPPFVTEPTVSGGFVFNRNQPQADQRCFVETGFCIGGIIRAYWEQQGGLLLFGYPISPQLDERVEGVMLSTQWFERNRIEVHPEQTPPNDVLLGRLGIDVLAQQGHNWREFPQREPNPACDYFAETGHNVCGDIRTFWYTHGIETDGVPGYSAAENLALFGLPLSELQLETLSDGTPYGVQWFERARIELHPHQNPPHHVLMGLLGKEMHP